MLKLVELLFHSYRKILVQCQNLPSPGQTLIPNVVLSYQLLPALAFGLIKFSLKYILHKHGRICCTCSSLYNITPWISTQSETNLICQCLCSPTPWYITCCILSLSALLRLVSQAVPGSVDALSPTQCPNQMSEISPIKSVYLYGIL